MAVDQPVRIIAEIGINHNGSVETAAALIKAAAKARCWGIKFQYRNLERAYGATAHEIGDEMLKKEIHRNYLSPADILELVKQAHGLDVRAGISTFEPDDLDDFGADLSAFDFFKVPSAELEYDQLIDRMLATGEEVFLSTGCHSEAQVEQALGRLDPTCNWTALHCVSNYPVAISNPKLGQISWLQRKWNRPVGYSSHDEHWMVCLLALQLGAAVIERHITFDRAADGLDHSTSSTPDEFALMAEFAENLPHIIAGDSPRIPNQGEHLNLQNLGRSYFAKEPIQAGQPVTREKLTTHTPRTGLGHAGMTSHLGQTAVSNVAVGDVISRSTFVDPPEVSSSVVAWARGKSISLPVRFHDFKAIRQKFPIGAYEFHLSYSEVRGDFDLSACLSDDRYSIHLPDYISPTQLMDPFSQDADQRDGSFEVLNRTVDLCKLLQDMTGKDVPIVGSFSCVHDSNAKFFEDHTGLFETFRADQVAILPQWLPPIAWYFGGSVKLQTMSGPEDLAFLKDSGVPFCMDVCHLFMGAQYWGFNAADAVRDLAPQIKHVHIADALGVDGEGVAFGEGDPENLPVILDALNFECLKVVEVWQGHLDGYTGFANALIDLERLNGQRS